MNKNLIYGKHTILEFLEKHPKMLKTIWTKDLAYLKSFNLNDYKVQIIKTTEKNLDQMFDQTVNHQGMVAEIKEFNYTPFSELLTILKAQTTSLVLLLDQIHDPYNFGAIIRTAVLLGVDGIVILDRKQAQVNSGVLKTSSGTAYDLKISKVNNLTNAIKQLKDHGFWVYSTNLNNKSVDFRTVDFANKSVLVIGNEQKGVSDLVTKNSDLNIFIPSNKTIDSFNVSVASALICFQIATKLAKV
ncbi:23S rRNA (guanosine(2251)-2'-O)-methyltransferase RlmB [Mycoplasma putrefaciens]|uniref:rRNA Methyltransferase, TrmH family group 3 protein n=1 Tax=Mycoplasma putrefaciens (strain ATCC 15718 / NCTC 10155 / C30 KS-1 / KS-1) TaxID=743965 RepID=A0A7U4E9E3_MYCPK|nr:23S rRNA (guanosine(2251)-2'-O)-methyltransferase RlmB [Mycoplasma putrefaciens]AEM68459.1 rRNA Methyltransferase, TrmH family group 3 protein [Mycoplasma putrefaciens KS1]